MTPWNEMPTFYRLAVIMVLVSLCIGLCLLAVIVQDARADWTCEETDYGQYCTQDIIELPEPEPAELVPPAPYEPYPGVETVTDASEPVEIESVEMPVPTRMIVSNHRKVR